MSQGDVWGLQTDTQPTLGIITFVYPPRANPEPQDLGLSDREIHVFLSLSMCMSVNPERGYVRPFSVLPVPHLFQGPHRLSPEKMSFSFMMLTSRLVRRTAALSMICSGL